jgi:hypothetical protein
LSDRRRQRSADPSQALHLQLAACCADGEVAAMAVADDDGVPLALAGRVDACRDVAGRIAAVAARIRELECTLLGNGGRWDVSMRKVPTEAGEVLVCAVGGTAEARRRHISRTCASAQRILAS